MLLLVYPLRLPDVEAVLCWAERFAAGWALSAVAHADSGRIGRQSQLQICSGKSSHQ